ncbi:Pentatricopeptide repeat superfamily protein [Perilla frutescens var. frutescens]|nr:Pentatricopeptide repeat superfamily protein [Perilla frutescens var. frutescens]
MSPLRIVSRHAILGPCSLQTNYVFLRQSHNLPAPHCDDSVLERKSDTHQLLDEMPNRDVKSATALIGQFAKRNLHAEAIACFSRMLFWGIKPNDYTFTTVIHSSTALRDLHLGKQIQSHAIKIGLSSNVFAGSAILDLHVKLSILDDALRAFEDINEPNVFSYSTLIRGYTKEGRLDEAGFVFRSMPERNVVCWNTMISGCSQSGRNEEAVNLFVKMLREGITPIQSSYPSAIIAAANIGSLGLGRSIHACAVKFLGELGLFIANSLISLYAKCGSMEDSLVAFNKIKMHDKNVVSWNALICGYAQNGQGNAAVDMYQKMELTGVQPNSVTLLGLLLACNHAGLVDEGYEYFNWVSCEDPSLLKAEHYACLIDSLSRSGRFEEAERFLHNLPFDSGVGFWKALLGGCQVHSNFELGEVAARKILELDPGDVSSYVMLSNAHSAAGRWESVLDTRQKMRDRGLSRIPGSSWIEIRSKIHVFVTADKRHSNKDHIYMTLRLLLDHARDRSDTNIFTGI